MSGFKEQHTSQDDFVDQPSVPVTLEQWGNLHNWDVFVEEMCVKLEAEKPQIVLPIERNRSLERTPRQS